MDGSAEGCSHLLPEEVTADRVRAEETMMSLALITAGSADTWGMHGDMGAGWWAVMMIWMVIIWVAIPVGVIWLIGLAHRPRGYRETPLEALASRFAEGTLSVDEYHQQRAVLLGKESRIPR